MKKRLCALLALMMLLTSVSALGEDLPRQYPLSENGEATVDDVLFSGVEAPRDNNRVFYEIFVGSFSDSDGDGIGDLRGIINRMDYLNDGDPESGLSLGVEGLWLTPIFQSPSYHKYDVTDFYQVDKQFGTEEDLKELIDLCHERDVKLILDLPINHTATDSRWFKNFKNAHVMQNPDNDYYNFYNWLEEGETAPAGQRFTKVFGLRFDLYYEANFDDSMPEPDFDQPFVRETFLNVAKHYLDLGVDGFRFDAAKYIYYGDHEKSAEFWDWYVGELKKIKPDLYTVAEVWDGDGVIDRYVPIMNCFNFTASQVDGIISETAHAGDVNRFTAYIQKTKARLEALRPDAMNVLFVSNHDMDRASGYLTAASGQMIAAASLYILSPGSPFIYYGEEIGLRGSRGGANTDANRRLAMLWGDGDTVRDPAGSTYPADKQTPYSAKDLMGFSSGLYTHYKKLLMLRKANPEIARGEYAALKLNDTKAGGFVSTWNGSSVLVLHNTTARTQKIDLSEYGLEAFQTLAGFAGVGEARLEDHVVTLEGQTSAVLR